MEEKKYMELISLKMPPPGEIPKPEDIIQTVTHKFRVDVAEKQDELLMSAVYQIGGNTYEDVTIDKNKVLDALGKYVAKRVKVEVSQMPGIAEIVSYVCPTCNHVVTCTLDNTDLSKVPSDVKTEHKYCNFCGQHLDWGCTEEYDG